MKEVAFSEFINFLNNGLGSKVIGRRQFVEIWFCNKKEVFSNLINEYYDNGINYGCYSEEMGNKSNDYKYKMTKNNKTKTLKILIL